VKHGVVFLVLSVVYYYKICFFTVSFGDCVFVLGCCKLWMKKKNKRTGGKKEGLEDGKLRA